MSNITQGLIPKWIIVHHAGGTDAEPNADASGYTLKQCDADHKVRFKMLSSLGYYVAYTDFMDKNGKITKCREDNEEGAHCTGYNNHKGDSPKKSAIGICLAGNFDAFMPTDAQIKALRAYLLEKMARYSIPASNVVPHRTFAHKSCYGTKLADSWARDLVKGTPTPTPVAPKIKQSELGKADANVSLIQSVLKKGGYVIGPLNEGVYDQNMAQAVLHFQMTKQVASLKEMAELRGEMVGPKTVKALNM